MNKVAVIIPSWNGCDDTLECLSSVCSQDYEEVTIYVADNNSTDSSVDLIQQHFSDVVIIQLHENTGFTGACNAGIKQAIKDNADYVFLLNNDTIIESPTVIDEMVSCLDDEPVIGMLSPTILYADSSDIWFSGGEINRNTGIVKMHNHGSRYSKCVENIEYCSFLVGCSLFVRASVLEQLGGLYQPYFLTSEESELCVRISDLGYKLASLNNTCIHHKVSRSMGEGSPLQAYFLYRNKLLFVKRNHKEFGYKDFLAIVVYYTRGIIKSFVKGNIMFSVNIIRGVIDFMLGRYDKGAYKDKL